MWTTLPGISLRELGTIRSRTLIAAGDCDDIRPEHTAELARSIPGATLWIVPGASHDAMHDQPALVIQVVLRFLSE